MIDLTNIAQWENALAQSSGIPQVIFKHSKTCPASSEMLHILEGPSSPLDGDMYRVTVQTSQDVSDQIGRDLGVPHETPQLIIVKNRKSVYAASHDDIDLGAAAQFLR